VSCLCYLRGLGDAARAPSVPWLFLGGVAAGWAFLIRQFAVLVPLAFVLVLAARALAAGRPRANELLAAALVPALAVLGWWLWSRRFPQSWASASAASRSARFVF